MKNKMREKIQKIIEDALLGAIADKYIHGVLNEKDIARESTADIMDYLREKIEKNLLKMDYQKWQLNKDLACGKLRGISVDRQFEEYTKEYTNKAKGWNKCRAKILEIITQDEK